MTNIEGGGEPADRPTPAPRPMMTPISHPLPGPTRPAEVDRAVFWWRIAIGVALVSDVIGLIVPPSQGVLAVLLKLLAPNYSGPVPTPTGPSVFTLVIQVVALALWITMVYHVGRGSNSARWWLTIIAVIEGLVLLGGIVVNFAVPSVASVVTGIVGLAEFVPVLLGIVAMHQPGARIYFQRLT